MRRSSWLLAGVLVLTAPAAAHAEKLPVDEGLEVTLTPAITTMRVGQTVDFSMSYTDDDAFSVETSLEVERGEGVAMAGDGVCSSPLQRSPMEGRAIVRARFRTPGRYVVRGVVATAACHGQLTRTGSERVAVSRTITVTR